jgi:hypothetical protein
MHRELLRLIKEAGKEATKEANKDGANALKASPAGRVQ